MAGPTTGIVGGPRHYEGPTLGQISVWKCPACGAENTGDLADGCTSCGSGSQRAQHVGRPPLQGRVQDRQPILVTEAQPTSEAAFTTWLGSLRGNVSPEIETLLYQAWTAAIAWARGTPAAPTDAPTPAMELRIITPKSLLLRVIVTLEAVSDLPDGQQSDDLLNLIAELKELVE